MGCAANTGVANHEPEKVQPLELPSRRQNFHRSYLLEDKLGEGCFAVVYGCRRSEGGQEEEFAVKITDIRRHKVDHPDRNCERAQQEATVLKLLGSHPHCCRFIDSMFCRRFHYLVMEKYSTSLLQALKNFPELTERSLSGVVQQMFRGVAAVHAHGFVHRDVKPDNFLCEGPDATVKLCDFGFAQKVPQRPAAGCLRGIYGTAPFMSPEMITAAHGIPTDVWSLGVIMYIFLLGEFPYIPEKPSRELMRMAIASGKPEPPFSCRVAAINVSQEALGLTRALLSRNPEKRIGIREALGHGWFSTAAKQTDGCCLRPALHSAERMGAFGASSACGGSPVGFSNADRTLHELQKKYRWQGMSQDGEPDDLSQRSSSKSSSSPRRTSKSSSPRRGTSPSRRKSAPDHKLSFSGEFDGSDGHRFGVLIAT